MLNEKQMKGGAKHAIIHQIDGYPEAEYRTWQLLQQKKRNSCRQDKDLKSNRFE
ncbi:MAG: hypothetical protein LLG06_10370 [Desulfobacteraceae bacterium]|nr:hypothetical protein [Desulfobacteraceae bacterium]